MKHKWDKQRIIDELKRLDQAGEDLSYNRMTRRRQSLVSAAAYHFGSYRKAVEKSGVDYASHLRRPRWSKPAIIRLIKQARRSGESLHWSAVIARGDELTRAAFAALQDRLFGSWDRALHAAGLDADEVGCYRKWTASAIAAELKERARDGEPVNSGAMQKDDPGLHAAALRYFGSYEKALRAAGLDPAGVRQRRRWTPADIVRELRAFRRRHGGLTDGDLRRLAPALYGAALRQFGSIESARKAAAK